MRLTKRYKFISELYYETCKRVTASTKEWEAFLQSACNNYKLRFDEQLLVYAQRPDAVAVLAMNKENEANWNRTFGRWVNRGAKGIAVFGNIGSSVQSIKYYFDISDTHPGYYNSKPVPLWEMQSRYEPDVIQAIERIYGKLEDKTTLVMAVFSAAKNAVSNSLEEYTNDLLYVAQDSFFAGLADDMVIAMYKQVVETSIAYMILSRLGVNTGAYFEPSDFENVLNFNTPETLNALGFAIGSLTKPGLREIARTIFSIEDKNRIIDEPQIGVYNGEKTQGGFQNEGNHIQSTWELPNTGFETAGTSRGNFGNIRADEEDIPHEAPLYSILQPFDEGNIDRTSGRGGKERNGDGETASKSADGARRANRSIKGKSVYDLDSKDGQYSEYSEGNRENGNYLQLNQDTNQADEKSSAYIFSQETIDAVLCRGSGMENGKLRIYHQFQKNLSSKEKITFLKDEYGVGGASPVIQGTNIGEMHDGKGIHLTKGGFLTGSELVLSWKKVETRIGELIRLDKYLNNKEMEKYLIWVNGQEETALAAKDTAGIEENTDEPIEQYEYHLGDKVYLGATEYEILSLDENRVLLFDSGFPLLNREEPRSNFEKMIKENPLNNHLKTINSSEISSNATSNLISGNSAVEPENKPTSITDAVFWEHPWKENKSRPMKIFVSNPNVPVESRRNFELDKHEVPEVGKKERCNRNIDAIRVLKTCKAENRLATPDEQVILSRYVGWGGIPEVFDDQNSAWAEQYQELKAILDDEEYASAKGSILTAFYTPLPVIHGMYKALEQMGFATGNILEPSCGIGNFIGLLPSSMGNAKMYGVELDKISAGIAQNLYQKATIASMGFENVEIPDNFFDVVIGNVPFGDIRLNDKRYDKYHFLIHDYFFAKSLDKLRPGGVLALITSKGTMDKKKTNVRKYLAQRAELLGAIRLPNNVFSGNGGTEVVSDILFLKKRERMIDIEPEWVHLNRDKNGIEMNSYFVQHPEMVLGSWKTVTGRFGEQNIVVAHEGVKLQEQIEKAISNIHAKIDSYEAELKEGEDDNFILADPSIRNFSYTILDDTVYFRENSIMLPLKVSPSVKNRVKGLIAIRDSARKLLELQLEDYSEEEIQKEQKHLNILYDQFTKQNGIINSRANISAFSQDSSFPLISALEILNEDGTLKRKADMFYKRTIKPHVPVNFVDSASEALTVSVGEKACVDIGFMCSLTGKTESEIYSNLRGAIFLNPLYEEGIITPKYLTADEYLSGNIREKLLVAKAKADTNPEEFLMHVEALTRALPKELNASEIFVRLGSTWLPEDVVEKFMFSLLDTPNYCQWKIKAHYSQYTSEWNIENKNYDRSNVKANTTYGTNRINAYKIIEETLNLRDVRIFDYVLDENGNKKAVLNSKETAIAQAKQEQIKQCFKDWIWTEPSRREILCKIYNEKFNSVRPREYDGSHIRFHGMNPEITLKTHQKNAVAHILYGGNTLLAHVVGAGKTFEMVAAAMELKQLGLCNKSLFVVPNHLTEQWAAEFMLLYPAANILVATRKDFETKNRKKFCGRIATGDYDAVIIGHSQFEKIPMSAERQKIVLERQLNDIMDGLEDLRKNHGEKFSIKQLEKTKKSLERKLEKLNDQSKKDDLVTFEELGIDRLFVDESHNYKNLFLYTKMRNVGGIAQTETQKSSDLFMKCQYLDELTGGKGTVFATGTPISNSMVELYTIQRYLQYSTLEKQGLHHFDAWASSFGETVTAVELKPEGTGYRTKTRFAKFYNLPELMAMFKEVADIQTADMLNLPVPKVRYHNISVKPSEIQKKMVQDLAQRAEAVRNGMVLPNEDNMLRITNDGRKLALDQRLINPMLPDFEGSKLNACVDYLYETWIKGTEKRLTQLFFCDLSTPKADGNFSVYNDIRKKLIDRGIPKNEICFIHEADTEAKKQALFQKVRNGDVRILMGSTQKMGAGTNVQNKLVASYDLDCPWRPSDLEQRLGRIVRQGNENSEVDVYRFVTEGTFDAYLYQLVEKKQEFVSQIMSSKSPVRAAEDIDETALSYAEIKMLATGNPHIKEKMDLDIQVQKLNILKANYLSEKYVLEDKIMKLYPQQMVQTTEKIMNLKSDIEELNKHPKPQSDHYVGIEVRGVFYSDKKAAGAKILEACKSMSSPEGTPLGKYRGFQLSVSFDIVTRNYVATLHRKGTYSTVLGTDAVGNLIRIDNTVERIEEELRNNELELENLKTQLETAKLEVEKPFLREKELKEKSSRLQELNIILNLDKHESEIVENEVDDVDIVNSHREKEQER